MLKRLLLTSTFIFLAALCLNGQIVINMEQEGGVYKVPCSVNGVKMKFIFDTGASVVSLSKTMATYMEDNGYLNKSDYLGNSQIQIADGSKTDVQVVNLKDFEIGGLHLKDVVATVKDGQNVPLLMGQSAIEKLGRISIEQGRLIIHKRSNNLSEAELIDLRASIKRHDSLKQYESVMEESYDLMRATKLKGDDYYYFIKALTLCEKFDEVISIGKDWETSGITSSTFNKESILYDMATAYSISNHPNEAIRYYQKSLLYCPTSASSSALAQISSCYIDLNNKSKAEKYIKKALSAHYTYLNKSLLDVLAGDVQDPSLGYIYWIYALFEETFNYDNSQRDYYARISAKCGLESAIDYCFRNNINYTK